MIIIKDAVEVACNTNLFTKVYTKPQIFSAIPHEKFEDKYLILNMYSYLNHPQYNNFIQYLNSSNRVAVIFCKSDDEIFNIINSDLVLKYKVRNLKDRDKILEELRKDFDAIRVEYGGYNLNQIQKKLPD